MTTLTALKWLAQALIFATGVWALFGAESTRVDVATGRRKLTTNGWARIALLAIGLAVFAASDHEERTAARARQRLAELEAQQQREQIEYLRQLYLLQFELTRIRVAFEVGEDERRALAAALAPTAEERAADHDLVYFSSGSLATRRASGERWEVEHHLPMRGVNGVYADESLAWRKLEAALRELVGCRLELGAGELLVEVMGRHWPCEFHYDGRELAFVIEKPGLALWHLRDAALTVACPPGRARMPARLTLKAEDPKLDLARTVELAWRSEELYAFTDADGNEQKVTRLVSGPHALDAIVRER